jgi:peptidyl-prolyl cis-trans isomerase A (cyclophilin A)
MDIVDQLYAGYGEGAPAGQGPNQGLIQARGNSYLKEKFPKLSYVISAK